MTHRNLIAILRGITRPRRCSVAEALIFCRDYPHRGAAELSACAYLDQPDGRNLL